MKLALSLIVDIFVGLFICLVSLSVARAQTPSRDFSFSRACENRSSEVLLSLTGDILIHDGLYQTVMQSPERFYGLIKRVAPLFNKADFSYANLEGPAALGVDRQGRDRGDVGFTYDLEVYSGTNFSFNYHPSILRDLKRAGLDILSTANNHSLDRGALGIDKTIDAFRELGLPYTGTRKSNERNAGFHAITRVKGFQIAWVACTEMLNGNPDRRSQVLSCYQDSTVELIRSLAKSPGIDAVIVTPHWGDEYAQSPNTRQRAYARKFLEAGATAVVGSHPHVLQPWEKYVTQDGREGLIVYSLGNFLVYQAGINKKSSAVVYLQLAKSGSSTWISSATYTATYRDGSEVFPTSSGEVLNHVSQFFGTVNRRMANQSVVPSCR